ncbi:hypothetical protein ABIA33_005042 [Streptacidiphilus sp. MAP12-16]
MVGSHQSVPSNFDHWVTRTRSYLAQPTPLPCGRGGTGEYWCCRAAGQRHDHRGTSWCAEIGTVAGRTRLPAPPGRGIRTP